MVMRHLYALSDCFRGHTVSSVIRYGEKSCSSATAVWTLHASRECLHRAVRRQSGVGIFVHERSWRRLARG